MNSRRKICFQLAAVVGVGIIFFFFTAVPATAQYTPIVPQACRAGGSGCTLCHMGELVINFTNFLMYVIALPATVVLVAAGGIILMVSGASEERRTLGKKILTSTLIGVIIVLLAWLGVDTIIKILTGSIGSGSPGKLIEQWGPWNKFEIPAGGCPL